MRILGLDPGFHLVGFGIVEKNKNGKLSALDFGVIETPKNLPLPKRLAIIFDCLSTLIATNQIDEIALEELFFSKNVKTALQVAQSRGVIALAATKSNKPLFEYTPNQVKSALTGTGNATKKQVEFMVQQILSIPHKISPDDASDALALALCHANTSKLFVKNFLF